MDIKAFFKEKKWKQFKKDQWLILFLAGVLILVIALPTGGGKNDTDQDQGDMIFGNSQSKNQNSQQEELERLSSEQEAYEAMLETRLEEILCQVDGVGQVQVMITIKNNGESVVEKDKESVSESIIDKTADTQNIRQESKETTIYENQTDEGGPFVSTERKPEVEGVLVVAQGGDNGIVAANISEAIQALFNIEIHNIKIVKMNIQEGTN